MKKPNSSDLSLSLIFSIIVLLVSILVGKAYDLLTLRNVAFGIVLTICVIFGLFGLVLAFEGKRYKDEIENLINRLEEIIPPISFHWLYSDTELAKAEEQVEGDSIWIISPDLTNIAEKQMIIKAVKSNIRRGIQYTYIVPDSEIINGTIPSLRNIFSHNEKLLKLIRLPETDFRFLSVTHIAIFNANMTKDKSPEVFLELPVEDTSSQKLRGYWIKISRDASLAMTGRFRKIVESHNIK